MNGTMPHGIRHIRSEIKCPIVMEYEGPALRVFSSLKRSDPS